MKPNAQLVVASTSTSPPTPVRRTRARRRSLIWLSVQLLILAVYLMALAAIAFWPVPIDQELGPLLDAITQRFPWLTYERIEFAANVLLFVPLGALLALILRPLWVLPIALVTTVVIESVQAATLTERTSTLSDVIANLIGAVLGTLAVVLIQLASRRRRRV